MTKCLLTTARKLFRARFTADFGKTAPAYVTQQKMHVSKSTRLG